MDDLSTPRAPSASAAQTANDGPLAESMPGRASLDAVSAQKASLDDVSLDMLPSQSRNLLKIQVPLAITLASKKESVWAIVKLVPGSIIQFAKSCEGRLELEAGSRTLAEGECVKLGEKLGLRITAMRLPAERFGPLRAAG